MKKYVIFLFVFGFCSIPTFAQKTQTIEKQEPYFKRITLIVSDIEHSLTIYRDILGFTVNSRKQSDKDSYSYPVFMIPEEAELAFATLDGPQQNRTLGLTEVKGVELPKTEGIRMSASVIKVDDLERTIAKIKILGLKTTQPEIVNGKDFYFAEQAFIDFDGHLIVLYEVIEK